MNMSTEIKDKGWMPYYRSDRDALLDGKITPNAYDLYLRIRHAASLYGILQTSLSILRAELTHRKWSENYINKLLLVLKKSGLIYYETRSGRRGSFNIRFEGFFLNDGRVSVLPQSKSNENADTAVEDVPTPPEVRQSLSSSSQRFTDIKTLTHGLAKKMSVSEGRGSNNDNDIEKEKIRSYPLKRNALVSPHDFEPHSRETAYCKKIAIAIGERDMNFLLGTLHDHGFQLIEQAWLEYERSDKTKIRGGRAAYFNGIVQNLVANKTKAS